MRTISTLLILIGIGCACARAPSHSIVHVIRPGETLSTIADRYGVECETLVAANHLSAGGDVTAGSSVKIPQKKLAPWSRYFFEDEERAITPPWEEAVSLHRIRSKAAIPSKSGFIWPLDRFRVTSKYGKRGRHHHHSGIDLGSAQYAPVFAAASGRIVFSGYKRGYGRVVIIRHNNRFTSVYAHNSQNGVVRGAWVKRGEVIGLVGRSGNATGSHLHFEIWSGTRVVNPLLYLPKSNRPLIAAVKSGRENSENN